MASAPPFLSQKCLLPSRRPSLKSALFLSTSSGIGFYNTLNRSSLPLFRRVAKSSAFPTRFSIKPISASASSSRLHALIFDCDGVILESEHLHRTAYNDAFEHFNVRCSPSQVLNWDPEFYDQLQNRIGGGKPKMRWYFKEHGWPSSSIFQTPPTDDADRAKLIDTLQDWKTERYKQIIKSGSLMF